MFTLPTPNNNTSNASEQQTNGQVSSSLQGRFPGWTFVDGQYNNGGQPQKAHVKDRSGRVWTVWFTGDDQISQVAEGSH